MAGNTFPFYFPEYNCRNEGMGMVACKIRDIHYDLWDNHVPLKGNNFLNVKGKTHRVTLATVFRW